MPSLSRIALPCTILALGALAAPTAAQQQAQNLVYTAVAPCRVADTRLSVAGRLETNETRAFHVVGASNDFGAQGGTVGGCGLPGYNGASPRITAVMFDFVAVNAAAAGNLRAWGGGAAPNASVINYGRGETVANGVVVPVDQDGVEGADLRLRADVGATHVVVDVLGYFSPLALTDGAGSGLDADQLDGLDATAFAAAAHAHAGEAIVTGTVAADRIDGGIARGGEVLPLVLAGDGPGSNVDADRLDGLDSAAFQRRYAKVATVAVSGTGDYADPVAAMNDLATWCGTPSFSNRCLLRILPGVYGLSTALLTGAIDIEGSGQATTVLWRDGGSDPTAATVVGNGGGELRHLAIISSGGEHTLGLLLSGAGRVVRDVYVSAQGSSLTATAVRVTGGSPRIDDSFFITFGPAGVVKTLEVTGSSPYVFNTELRPASNSAAECTAVHSTGGTLELVDARVFAIGACARAVGVRSSTTDGNRIVRGGRIVASNAATANVGVQVDAGAKLSVYGTEVQALGAGGIGAVNNSGPTHLTPLHLVNAQVSAFTSGIATSGGSATRVQQSIIGGLSGASSQAVTTSSGDSLYVGASQIVGTVTGDGGARCVGAYSYSFFPLDDACQP